MSEWEDRLLEASYGGIPLFILDMDTDEGRDVPVYIYPHVDGCNTEDLGANPRICDVTLVFFGDGHLEHLRQFLGSKDLAALEPLTFVHPILGAYTARVGPCRVRAQAEPRDHLEVQTSFIEATTERAVFEPGQGRGLFAQADGVETAAASLDVELAAAGLSSTTGAQALSTAQGWVDKANLVRRDVEVGLSSVADLVQTDITEMGLLDDVALYPIYLAYTELQRTVRILADALIAKSPRLTTVTLSADLPLLVVSQRLYGGAKAVEKFPRLLELNRVPNPALVPAGTVLTVEVS